MSFWCVSVHWCVILLITTTVVHNCWERERERVHPKITPLFSRSRGRSSIELLGTAKIKPKTTKKKKKKCNCTQPIAEERSLKFDADLISATLMNGFVDGRRRRRGSTSAENISYFWPYLDICRGIWAEEEEAELKRKKSEPKWRGGLSLRSCLDNDW